jgi:hypothetical protein
MSICIKCKLKFNNRGYDWHGPSALNVFSAISGLEKLQELLPPHFECIDSTGGDWVNGKLVNGLHQLFLKSNDTI